MDEQIPAGKNPSLWPSPQDYNEAVQNPLHSFRDEDLAGAEPELDALGLPRPSSGMFASVYRMRRKGETWAARCFLRQTPDLVERYVAISSALSESKFSFTVNFEMQEGGIRVHGRWLPLLKMAWCAGETLEQWLAKNRNDAERLERFQQEFAQIVYSLRENGIAHGDLQHGNILIDGDTIKLVDYDAMYVPSLKGMKSHELGHAAYQHPARTQLDFSEKLDDFSAWLIHLSIEIIKCSPRLWDEFACGNDALLFRKADLLNPSASRLFFLLEADENVSVNDAARLLRYLLSLDLGDIPRFGSELIIPDEFPDLLPVDQEESSKQVVLFDASPDLDSGVVDQGTISHGAKRPRSRVKGGFTGGAKRTAEIVAAPVPTRRNHSPVNSALAQLFKAPMGTAPSRVESETGAVSNLSLMPGNRIASLDGSVEAIEGTYYRSKDLKKTASESLQHTSQMFTVMVLVLALTFILLQMFR